MWKVIILVLIIVGIGWVLMAIGQALEEALSSRKKLSKLGSMRKEKYGQRHTDTSRSLLERNDDIIETFKESLIVQKYPTYSYRRYGRDASPQNYYFENLTRDCINEIAVAENKLGLVPGTEYLSNWQKRAPEEWVEFSNQLLSLFHEREKELRHEQEAIDNARRSLQLAASNRPDIAGLREVTMREGTGALVVNDLQGILMPNEHTWSETISNRLENFLPKEQPRLHTQTEKPKAMALNKDIDAFNEVLREETRALRETGAFFSELERRSVQRDKDAVLQKLNFIVDHMTLPKTLPKSWNVDYDSTRGIAIVELRLPDIVHEEVFKEVELKKGTVNKPLSQKEAREYLPKFHPALLLRTAYEIYRNNPEQTIELLVVNGWVEYDDPKTGQRTKTYTASLAATKEQVNVLNLKNIEPIQAFANLKGKSAGKLIDIIPVAPVMSLDRKDKRFIETKEVLNNLSSATNLAAMDWQDFENLIAELFQKVFSEEGVEIKLTQSSRDKGVDAIVLNPDPIRGGKYVIQAKRYTHTVDVSAVRDLVAVVAHEGASRGILVTTSSFGADAYAFVQGKPITLLDGAQLLGLLEEHGYKFKISLEEARKLNAGSV